MKKVKIIGLLYKAISNKFLLNMNDCVSTYICQCSTDQCTIVTLRRLLLSFRDRATFNNSLRRFLDDGNAIKKFILK